MLEIPYHAPGVSPRMYCADEPLIGHPSVAPFITWGSTLAKATMLLSASLNCTASAFTAETLLTVLTSCGLVAVSKTASQLSLV